MKKILLIVALVGFTAIGGYAQNKTCSCKHKVVHHRAIIQKAETSDLTAPGKTEDDENALILFVPKDDPTCYQYHKNGVVVTECPNVFYDNADNVGFMKEGEYSGYYPLESNYKPAKTNTACQDSRTAAGTPIQQHTIIIEQCDAPVDPYFSLWDWPKK